MSDLVAHLPGEAMVAPDGPTPIDPSGASVHLEELKHSLRMHLHIMQGPSPELAVFLVKLIDFIEDTDAERRKAEMAKLAYTIVEAIALHVQRSVDARVEQATSQNKHFPENIRLKSDHLLVVIGKNRNLPDRFVAKRAVLIEVADCLRALTEYTRSQYPQMTDLQGTVL